MLSIEEKLEQKGRAALITEQSEIEIVKFEENAKQQEESYEENYESSSNEIIENNKREIKSKRIEAAILTVGKVACFAFGAASILTFARDYKLQEYKSLPVSVIAAAGAATTAACGGIAMSTAIKWTKKEIDELQEEIDEEYEDEISKILLIKR